MNIREKFGWIIGFAILLGGCLQSCVTLEKKIAKAKVVAYQNPNEFAEVCATLYPVKEVTKTEIKYIPADNKDYTGQINQAVKEKDSIQSELDKLKEIAAKDKTDNCIDYKNQIPKLEQTIKYLSSTISRLQNEYEKCKSDTVNINTTSVIEEQAKYKALQQRYNDLDKKYAIEKESRLEAENKAKKRIWWLIGLVGVIGIGVLLKIKGILPF